MSTIERLYAPISDPLDQVVLGRQLGLWGQPAVSDIAGQNRLDTVLGAGHDITIS
jgi:hypothetical protein